MIFRYRIKRTAHVYVDCFIAPTVDHTFAKCGTLVFRPPELELWRALHRDDPQIQWDRRDLRGPPNSTPGGAMRSKRRK